MTSGRDKRVRHHDDVLVIEGNVVTSILAYEPGKRRDGSDFVFGYTMPCRHCHGEGVVAAYNEADRECDECTCEGGEWVEVVEEHLLGDDDFSDLELWAATHPNDVRAKVVLAGMRKAIEKRRAA